MISPVKFDKPFVLPKLQLHAWNLLGTERGNRHMLHTALCYSDNVRSARNPKQLVGICNVYELWNDVKAVGILLVSPKQFTKVEPTYVGIDRTSTSQFNPMFTWEGLNVLAFKSDLAVVFTTLQIASTLVVETE